METGLHHLRLVADTRPAITLPPVAFISTDIVQCAKFALKFSINSEKDT